MKRITLFILASTALIAAGCGSHFITDPDYRQVVREDLAVRASVLDAAEVDLNAMGLDSRELEAMEFLYAYMPLGDIVNHSLEYYLDHYMMTRRALDEMSWGKKIPERELRHFVLPVRVNNENLDDAREVFYRELAPRVKDLSMYDAVLEVNHWCHEKAVYMPSDRRTSSPLATVKTAYGRCGEESTLLVAALRSVGIPARQVYTPRWAHTDSNHAWVEAWVDGEWYFLGACEPEPVLDLGWFNAPASRGMLMHTNVFGRYDGPEDKVRVTPIHTEINVISNYAPESADLQVNVIDKDGTAVEGAKVEFKIYNYSEFNTVATKYSDAEGKVSLTAGLGDMMIYACKDGKFGFSKVTYGKDATVDIVLGYEEGSVIPHMEMEVVPPVENAQLPDVTEEQRAENTRRMEYEDSLRNAYVATFYDAEKTAGFAAEYGLDAADVTKVLVASRGNHAEISAFLAEASRRNMGGRAVDLLLSISEKDLRDTPAAVLADHLYNTPAEAPVMDVLCPRVETELLTPYREYLQGAVNQDFADAVKADPAYLVSWCRDSLTLHDEMSLRYVQLSPRRVWETRLADKGSREIFFVAMCRSLGVSAWRDTVTGVVKYKKDGKIYDVDFDAQMQVSAPKGWLHLEYDEIPLLDDPKYQTHFTISKFDGTSFVLQNYGKADTWSNLFRLKAEMDCGYYMLVSGSRMSGGNVLADVEFFTIEEDKTTVVDLVMRDAADQHRVIGSFDSEMKYLSVSVDEITPLPPVGRNDNKGYSTVISSELQRVEKSVLETTGRGYFAVALVDYGTEPVNHAFMDISAVASELEEWGRTILVVFASEEDYRKFRVQDFSLPSTVRYGIDADGRMRNMIASEMKLDKGGRLPLILVADTFNRVVFFSQGYSIGLGESLVKTSKTL